jgi:tetratricopeptide (TPR) repeat protein
MFKPMPREQQTDSERKNNRRWLEHLLRHFIGKRPGDTVAANIGEGARDVVVGKNIIQIGTLKIPIWILGVIALSVVIGAIAVVYVAISTPEIAQTIQEVQELAQATPTPVPAPTVTPTPTPAPIEGDFKIAIAKPVPLEKVNDPQVDEQISEFQNWYLNELETQIQRTFDENYQTDQGIILGIRTVPTTVDNLDARHQYYADYAQQIKADVVLYGVLDLGPLSAEFSPEFYVAPDYIGAAEITGPDAFGKAIEIPLSRSNMAWKVALDPLRTRIAALSAFMTGLAYFDLGEYDLSRKQFEKLDEDESNGWATEKGKTFLYLWLGTTHFFKALEQRNSGLDPEVVRCLASGEDVTDSECARQSYERAINDRPRAHIGLGNYWLEFSDEPPCDRFEKAIEQYEMAMAKAEEAAADHDAQFVETSLATMKTLSQLGLTHARALREGCPEIQTHDEKALVYLQGAMDWYEQADAEILLTNPMLRDLASRSSYWLGLVHKRHSRDDQALEALNQTVEIATPSGQLGEDPWQSIRWVAKNQIGAIYLAQVEAGNFDAFQQSEDALTEVTDAYEDELFGGSLYSFPDDPVTAAAAYYHLGRLYLAKAQHNQNEIDVSSLEKAETVSNQSTRVLEHDVDPAIVENLRDGLPWVSHLSLGDIYRLWSTIDDRKATLAQREYELVLKALESGQFKGDNELRGDAFDKVFFGLGAIHFANKDFEKAMETLNKICQVGIPGSAIYQKTNELLEQISDEATCDKL